jgi:hypothetical protein
MNEDKSWNIQELFKRIKEKVKAVGPYELDRLKRETPISTALMSSNQRPRQQDLRFSVNKTNQNPKEKASTEQYRKRAMEALQCFNCGGRGHKKQDCKLPFNHPKAKEGRNNLIFDNSKRLKRLQDINHQLMAGEMFSDTEDIKSNGAELSMDEDYVSESEQIESDHSLI